MSRGRRQQKSREPPEGDYIVSEQVGYLLRRAYQRKVIIEITEAGLTLVEKMVPRARAITELTFNGLNQAERVALLYTLRQIIVR